MIILALVICLDGGIFDFEPVTVFDSEDLMRPQYLAMGNGNLYVLDPLLREVHYWDFETGKKGGTFGGEGEGPGEFPMTNGIGELVVFKDKIIVFDSSLSKMHFFDKNHQFIETLPVPGNGRDLFFQTGHSLVSVTMSTSSKKQAVYLVDGNLNRTRKLDEMAYRMYQYIDRTSWILRPYANRYIIATNRNTIFVCQRNSNEIKVFDKDGNKTSTRTLPYRERDIEQKEMEQLRKNRLDHVTLDFEEAKKPCFDFVFAFKDKLVTADYDKDVGLFEGTVYRLPAMEKVGRVSAEFGEVETFMPLERHLVVIAYDEEDDLQIQGFRLRQQN